MSVTWQGAGWIALKAAHLSLGMILFGVIYYLGFFTSRAMRHLEPRDRALLIPRVLPAYFRWLRWEALWTIVSGVVLLIWKVAVLGLMPRPGAPGIWLLGIGMALTVYVGYSIAFVICPLQDRICALALEGPEGSPELDALTMRSRNYCQAGSWLGLAVVVFMVLGSATY